MHNKHEAFQRKDVLSRLHKLQDLIDKNERMILNDIEFLTALLAPN